MTTGLARPLYVLVLLLLSGPLLATEKLLLLNWEAYIADEVILRWQQETGIAIEQVYFDSDEKRDAILSTPQRHGIDIALVDRVATGAFGKKKLLAPLTIEQAPNLTHVAPRWQQSCYGYGSPYHWGTVGLVYRTDQLDPPPSSWKTLLEPTEQLKGHIGMLRDHIDTLIPPLILDQLSPLSGSRSALERAFERLRKQTPSVLTYDYPITYLQSGQHPEALHLALAYSGDQEVMNEISDTTHWAYRVPDEGSMIWLDCLTVMSQSPNKAAAYRFLDFLQRPEIAALNTEELYVASANQTAFSLLSDELKNDPTVYPSDAILKRSRLYEPIGPDNIKLRQRITGAILKQHEAR